MPRLHFDVQVMRESALSLQSALHTLSHQSTSLLPSQDSKDETNSALTRLHTLSQTHSNMTAAHALLKKAESWSALEPDVTRLLANSEFDAAADRLAASTDSLQVFEGTRVRERQGLMVSLQNQLEAGLSTAVVNAVNGLDFDTLVKLWATYGDSDLSFADFISKFFGEFLALVHAERQNMTKVYPDPQDCLAEFILTTVESLQPSLVQRLESEGLKGLISALETCKSVSSVGKTLEAMILFSPGLPTTPGRNPSGSLLRKPSHNRRTSKRFSISQRNDGKSLLRTDSAPELETIPPWELSLLEPFLEHQTDYASLELKLLNQSFEQICWENANVGRGKEITRRRGRRGRVGRRRGFPVCRIYAHVWGQGACTLDQFCAGVFEGAKEQCLPSPTTTTTTTAAGAVPPDEDLDYTAEDWSAFQLALRLLEGCRAAED
ncbi:Golgi complex component 7 (COG7) [Ceratobasidium sp. AG-Ba]|nr:Golgi complex component 7 (COG7) [Ceratobasidium sp. AG-Ba]